MYLLFNDVLDKSNKSLNESSIERMLRWLKDCDCAFISAFRNEFRDTRNRKPTCLGPNKDWEDGKRCAQEENRNKSKLMVADLLQLGYGITKMKVVCPEGMTDETLEECYLVVNRDNDENFLSNLLRISEYYNQDSVYYKEKGQTKGSLMGANNCGGPDYHQKGEDNEIKPDTASNYMLKLGNKAFSFVGNDAETTFRGCKENRKKKMKEALDFWRNMIEGEMLVKEDIHPLTRKTMGEELRKMRKNQGTTEY